MDKVIRYPRQGGRRAKRRLLTILFILCISITLYLLAGQAVTYLQAKGELNKLQSRQEKLKAENEALQQEIILLEDKDYLEIKARKELGLIKPGEIIFSVGD